MSPWCKYMPGRAEYSYNPRLSDGSMGFAIEQSDLYWHSSNRRGFRGSEDLKTRHGLDVSSNSPTSIPACLHSTPVATNGLKILTHEINNHRTHMHE